VVVVEDELVAAVHETVDQTCAEFAFTPEPTAWHTEIG